MTMTVISILQLQLTLFPAQFSNHTNTLSYLTHKPTLSLSL